MLVLLFIAAIDAVFLMGVISLVVRDQEHNLGEIFNTSFGVAIAANFFSWVFMFVFPQQIYLPLVISSLVTVIIAVFAFNAVLSTDFKRASIIGISFFFIHILVTRGTEMLLVGVLFATVATTMDEVEQNNQAAILENFLGPPMLAKGPEGTYLSGVQITLHEFGIQSLYPVFVKPAPKRQFTQGITYGAPAETIVKCYNKGYAVTTIELKQEFGFEAIRFTFMKIKEDGTGDPEDLIEGEWVGQTDSESEITTLGTKGEFLRGFKCFADEESIIHLAPLD
ncbi:MAG: hypothetical protein Q4G68_10900 [Planctomycetia bacterium]|nr:hypothetical protein [Planctomycetia bacterium]